MGGFMLPIVPDDMSAPNSVPRKKFQEKSEGGLNMNVQDEIKALKQRISELEKQVEQEEEFPQDGDDYWYINPLGIIMRDKWSSFSFVSEVYMAEIGNVFQTEQQAQFAIEKLKVEAELRNFSTKYQPYAELYTISFFHNNSQKVITITANQAFQDITFYFESEEKAKQAIESVGEERIKKYIFGLRE